MRPKAMLFDEPTSSLDPELTDEVLGVSGVGACPRAHNPRNVLRRLFVRPWFELAAVVEEIAYPGLKLPEAK